MDFLFRQLIYFGFFQAIFLILIYVISAKKRETINVYLIILVGILLMGLCGHLFYIENLFGGYRRWVGLSEFSVLFFGPTIYLFIDSSLTNRSFRLKDLFHYIPGVFYCLVVTFYYLIPSSEVINSRIASGELYRVVRILIGAGLAVNISYYILTVMVFVEKKRELQERVSFLLPLRFMQNFLIVIGLCLLTWFSIYLISLLSLEFLELDTRKFIWIAIALLILFILFYQLTVPEALRYKELFSNIKYSQSRLSKSDLNRLKEDLEGIMERKKPYLNAKLMKSDLANLLQINAPELSRLLNERIGMNFFEYVNYHRIQEFIRLAQTDRLQEMTLLGLAQEAGFNSKATFNKSFKKIMGCSPTDYLKK